MKEKLNRREFLEQGTKAALGAAVVGPLCAALSGCGVTVSAASVVPVNGLVTLNLSDYPNLQTVNGCYQISVQAASGTKILSVTNISNTVVAMSAICTHQGCTLSAWSGANFTCPCHGSVFSSSGQATTGPAATALTQYPTTVSATAVTFTVT